MVNFKNFQNYNRLLRNKLPTFKYIFSNLQLIKDYFFEYQSQTHPKILHNLNHHRKLPLPFCKKKNSINLSISIINIMPCHEFRAERNFMIFFFARAHFSSKLTITRIINKNPNQKRRAESQRPRKMAVNKHYFFIYFSLFRVKLCDL